MRIIVGAAASGKTTDLIRISAETGYYIVTYSHEAAYKTAQMARGMGLDIPFPLSFGEFLRKEYFAKGVKGFLIDNVDMLLESLTSVPIGAITLTAQE